jgi:hypothetical protein
MDIIKCVIEDSIGQLSMTTENIIDVIVEINGKEEELSMIVTERTSQYDDEEYSISVEVLDTEKGIVLTEEMKEKISRLKLPKRFSIRPILIHVNGVESAMLDEGYFDKVIDFGQFLE